MKRLIAILFCLCIAGSTQARLPHGSAAPSCGNGNFVIQFVLDPSVSGAPASFMQGMNAAACQLTAAISNPITISIGVVYTATPCGGGAAGSCGGSQDDPGGFTYTTLYNAYSAIPSKSADQTTFFNTLPTGSSINGISSFIFTSRALAKAIGGLGVSARDVSVLDGGIEIGSSVPTTSLVGVALHEITHAMGRETSGNAYMTFQWLTFRSAGVRYTNTASVAHYFSLDSGTTDLADFNTSADPSDFQGGSPGDPPPATPDDVFNESYNPGAPYTQALSAVDLRLLNVMGFKIP